MGDKTGDLIDTADRSLEEPELPLRREGLSEPEQRTVAMNIAPERTVAMLDAAPEADRLTRFQRGALQDADRDPVTSRSTPALESFGEIPSGPEIVADPPPRSAAGASKAGASTGRATAGTPKAARQLEPLKRSDLKEPVLPPSSRSAGDPSEDLAPEARLGDVIGGYKLEALLGKGGAGSVFRARHQDGREVALKVLSPAKMRRSRVVQRFLDEVRTASMVKHPALIEIYDTIDEASPRRLAYAMEYLLGVSLRAHMKQHGTVELRLAVNIAEQISSALAALHDAGIVHRDLKPENIMLQPASPGAIPRVKLLDYGVVKFIGNDAAPHPPNARGTFVGTPRYMAPEQAAGAPVDARSDLFALGVLLFEMITGRCPHEGDSLRDVVLAKLKGAPRIRVGADQEVLPKELTDLVDACLKLQPSMRPKDARLVSRGLQEVSVVLMAVGPVRAPNHGDSEKKQRPRHVPPVHLERIIREPSKAGITARPRPAVDRSARTFIEPTSEPAEDPTDKHTPVPMRAPSLRAISEPRLESDPRAPRLRSQAIEEAFTESSTAPRLHPVVPSSTQSQVVSAPISRLDLHREVRPLKPRATSSQSPKTSPKPILEIAKPRPGRSEDLSLIESTADVEAKLPTTGSLKAHGGGLDLIFWLSIASAALGVFLFLLLFLW